MLYKDNPFKILGVSPTDSRRVIARKAEEMELLADAQRCADARTILTNPQRRISAEVRWFPDCRLEETHEIETYISEETAGSNEDDRSWDRYCPLTQLNIQFALLDAQSFGNAAQAKYYVLGLSRLYESVDAESVRLLINESRLKAGFPEIANNHDIEETLNEIRSEIRRELSRRLQALPEERYLHIVTLISESYSGNQRYVGHAILEDAISEYQLYINDTLQKKGDNIVKTARFIAKGAGKIQISRAVSDLIDDLYSWDRLAQPLQLGALTKGSSHEESEEILRALRDLAITLHNEHGYSEESLALTKAIQDVFKELPEFMEQLSEDRQTLTQIVEEKETEDLIAPIMAAVDNACNELTTCSENQRITKSNALIQIVKNADRDIKLQFTDKQTADSLRSALGIHIRSFAVDLHNDRQMTEDALRIVNGLISVFSDLPEVAEKLHDDQEALNALMLEKQTTENILSGLKDLEAAVKKAKLSLTGTGERTTSIEAMLSKMTRLNALIKSGINDIQLRNQLREQIAYMVRSAAIELHNSMHDTENSLLIMSRVRNEFSDMSDVVSALDKDIATLNNQIRLKKMVDQRKKDEETATVRNVITAVVVVAILILMGSC